MEIMISYDYSELIQEIKEELRLGVLSATDCVQIKRSKKTCCGQLQACCQLVL